MQGRRVLSEGMEVESVMPGGSEETSQQRAAPRSQKAHFQRESPEIIWVTDNKSRGLGGALEQDIPKEAK